MVDHKSVISKCKSTFLLPQLRVDSTLYLGKKDHLDARSKKGRDNLIITIFQQGKRKNLHIKRLNDNHYSGSNSSSCI